MSGHAAEHGDHPLLPRVIAKPFRFEELVGRLRQLCR
jgi:hypothetical protein